MIPRKHEVQWPEPSRYLTNVSLLLFSYWSFTGLSHPYCHLDINLCVQVYLTVCLFIQPSICLSVIYLSKLFFILPVFSLSSDVSIISVFPSVMPPALSPHPFSPRQLKTWRQVRYLGRSAQDSWACQALTAIVLILWVYNVQLHESLLFSLLEDDWHIPEPILSFPHVFRDPLAE